MCEIISIFSKNKQKNKELEKINSKEETITKEDFSFEETVRRNMENHKRMRNERNKDNKSVIRSYRLKK